MTPQHDYGADTPEIRKYKKRFNSEILCAALWGVNLLIGTENGLMLLDRSGQGMQEVHVKPHLYLPCRKGIPTHKQAKVSADGSPRRTEYSGYHIRKEKQSESLLPFMA